MLKRITVREDLGIFILRIGFGIFFIIAGASKLFAGPATWKGVGMAGMGSIGINFIPAFWGFLAALIEFVGGIMLLLGLFVQLAAILMSLVMVFAVFSHVSAGDKFTVIMKPLFALTAFISLIFMGSGKYAVTKKTVK